MALIFPKEAGSTATAPGYTATEPSKPVPTLFAWTIFSPLGPRRIKFGGPPGPKPPPTTYSERSPFHTPILHGWKGKFGTSKSSEPVAVILVIRE